MGDMFMDISKIKSGKYIEKGEEEKMSIMNRFLYRMDLDVYRVYIGYNHTNGQRHRQI